MNEKSLLVGVDIGGSHITAALVDLVKGCKIKSTEIRRHVNSAGSATEILADWIDVIAQVANKYDNPVKKVGVAMPGPFDYGNGISWIKNMNKYDALYGLDIKEAFAHGLGIPAENIMFRNDAEAFLEGEVFCGAAKGSNKTIGITLGTGLGSASSMLGYTRDSNLGVSAFKDGIAEDYLSTRWFIKRYHELKGEYIENTKALVDIAEKGDKIAKAVFEEFCLNLSEFLIGFIECKQPDVVVVGGNIVKAEKLFLQGVRKNIAVYHPEVSIVPSMLLEEAALVGAACCWLDVKNAEVKND